MQCINIKFYRKIFFCNRFHVSKARDHCDAGRQGDEILQRYNSLCTLRRRIPAATRWIRVRACNTACIWFAREANLHVNIFQENKSIRMREEELLKLVIAVYEAASAFTRHHIAELRNSATSFGDNAARKQLLDTGCLVCAELSVPRCSRLICIFKCTCTFRRLQATVSVEEIFLCGDISSVVFYIYLSLMYCFFIDIFNIYELKNITRNTFDILEKYSTILIWYIMIHS